MSDEKQERPIFTLPPRSPTPPLSPHREKILEASVARFQELEQAVENQATKIRELEHELSLSDLENKQPNVHPHDAREAARSAEKTVAQAAADRVAYEVIFIQIAKMATQFSPPVPMTEITQTVAPPKPATLPSLCQKCGETDEAKIDVCPVEDCPHDLVGSGGKSAVADAIFKPGVKE